MDAAKGHAITTSGAFVPNWTDQSTNAFTTSQFTATDNGAYIPDAINFNPALRFDQTLGVSGFVFDTELHTTTDFDFEAYYVINNGADDTVDPILMNGEGSLNRFYLQNNQMQIGTADTNSSNTVPTGQFLVSGRWEAAANQNVSSVNATTDFIQSGTWSAYNANDFKIGYHVTGDNINRRYDGDIAEIVIYYTAHTPAQRVQVQTYLAIKYGITLGDGALAYKASDGTDVWTVDSIYNHDITAIGHILG